MHKFITWAVPLAHEAWLPILAQGDTVVQKAQDAIFKGGTDFGNANDSVRLGIILFILLAVLVGLAYLYVTGDRATIKELKAENRGLRDEIKANLASYERSYEDLRGHCETLTRGYWGVASKLQSEWSTLNRVLEERGILMRRPNEPEALPPPPVQGIPSKSGFLPARRIRSRPEETRE